MPANSPSRIAMAGQPEATCAIDYIFGNVADGFYVCPWLEVNNENEPKIVKGYIW